jgi:peptidoglycan/xylan/chitin deacetylase (PgdA/CDA1 family)
VGALLQWDEVSAVAASRTLIGLVCACFVLVGCAHDPLADGPAPRAAASPSGAAMRSSPAATTPTAPSAGGDECRIPARFAGQDVARLPVTDKVIALTFDAGANADGVPSIRATLHRTGVKATFFLTGSFVKRYPVKAGRLAARDVVGNHTMTHPDLTTLTDEQVTRQVRGAEDVIRSTTGQDPRRFFRFPYGARDAHLIGLLNDLCYVPFRWTVDTLGWKGTSGGQSKATVVARVVAAARPGAIVLMHVGSNPDDHTTLDADALPQIITRLRALGYRFVRLAWVMSPAP